MKDVLIYNSLGEQLIRLAQWDRDVYVNIEDAGITTNYPVHFFNKNSDQAYAVESTYSDGKLKAKIPDHLLREPYTICGYVQRNDGDSERRSDFRFIVGVVPKPQPSDYVLRSDPDYIEVESLKSEYMELQRKLDTALTEVSNRMPNYKIGPGLAVSENTIYVTAGTGGGGAPVDPTLSLEGAAADAKATGDAIKQIIDSANAEEPWDSGCWTIDPWINNEPGSAEGYSNSQTIQLEPNTKYTISISEDDGNTLYIAGENGGIYSAVQEHGGYQTFTTDETGRHTFWLLTPGRRYDDYINGTLKVSIVKGSLPKIQGKGVTKVSKDGWVIKTHENAPGELNNRYMDIYSPFGKYFSLNTGAYNDDPSDGDTWCGLTIGKPDYSGANEAGIHLAVPGSGMDISFMNAGILAELVFNMGVYGAPLEYGKYMFAFNEPDVPSYARFQIFKDAMPIYLTAGGIKVKNNNQAVKTENEAEWKTVNLYDMDTKVNSLYSKISIGTSDYSIYSSDVFTAQELILEQSGGDETPGVFTLTNSWDFTTGSLTDSVGGVTAVNTGCTIDSSGLTVPKSSARCQFGYGLITPGGAIEIDVVSADGAFSDGDHGRCFMFYDSPEAGGITAGLIYRHQTSNWAFYFGSWGSDLNPDKNIFSGKTVRLEMDADGYFSFYVNGELIGKSTAKWLSAYSGFAIGSIAYSYYNLTVSAVRIYRKEQQNG